MKYWGTLYWRYRVQGARQKAQGEMLAAVRRASWALRQLIFLLIFLGAFASYSPSAPAGEPENDYQQARLCFEELLKDRQKQNFRHHWITCIKKFQSVYAARPNGPKADDALLMTARLYAGLHGYSGRIHDKQRAIDYYSGLVKHFPKSPYRSKAKKALAWLSRNEIHQKKIAAKRSSVSKNSSKSNEQWINKSSVDKNQSESLAEVKDIRFWSSPSYTRVVIDVESEVPYTHRLLKKDPSIAKPMRLYVDLSNARIGPGLRPVVPIVDDLLSAVRAGQHSPDTVRLVLDIKSIDNFKIFSLRNPFRIVVDVSSMSSATPSMTASRRRFNYEPKNPSGEIPRAALAKQLALGVKRIVIDPGHGGKDPGATGHLKRVHEKNVALEISRRLASKIRHRLGCEAILTRNADISLSLEERTAFANTKGADLFISIHTNANKTMACHGIETYFLNLATDKDAILVAARENATSANNISDLEDILSDLMKNAKIEESSRLAGYVQEALIKNVGPRYSRVKNKGVKQAPFYVLLGAEMPCILIEVAFITNPRECRRLNTAGYQDDIADAIVMGIRHYIQEIRPAALTQAETGNPVRKPRLFSLNP